MGRLPFVTRLQNASHTTALNVLNQESLSFSNTKPYIFLNSLVSGASMLFHTSQCLLSLVTCRSCWIGSISVFQDFWTFGRLPPLGCRRRCKQPAFSVCPSCWLRAHFKLSRAVPTLLKIHFISLLPHPPARAPPISLAKLPPNAELAVQIRPTDYSWTESCRNVTSNSPATPIIHKVKSVLKSNFSERKYHVFYNFPRVPVINKSIG